MAASQRGHADDAAFGSLRTAALGAGGVANLSVANLPVGAAVITASYVGTGQHRGQLVRRARVGDHQPGADVDHAQR